MSACTGRQCLLAAFRNVGHPVAGMALGTLVFEILAIVWAFVVTRRAKDKDMDAGGRGAQMDNI